MTPLNTLTSKAMPLVRDNIDTDAIIPSREIKNVGKTGLAAGLFAAWRYLDETARTPDPSFILNDPAYAGAAILLAGANFGCGSSREHAVWALVDYGIRIIIAPSFAPIFQDNCIRNGVLPLVLAADKIAQCIGKTITVNLSSQTVQAEDDLFNFEIAAEPKAMLIEGLDAIALSLKKQTAINLFLAHDQQARPWVYLKGQQE
jgi:3-isopropylmalate/(R)-2-methylmalate dehydratase small subunit